MALYALLPFFVAPLVAAQSITEGPQVTGWASMQGDSRYATQRSCVQHCLWYNGPMPRGAYYNDWDDVGKELKCGASPKNFCYCATSYASSATSYFNMCIDSYCGTDDPNDYVSAMSIYNAYCETANGNPKQPVPTPKSLPASTTSSDSESTPTDGAEPSETSPQTGSSTTRSGPDPTDTAEGSESSPTGGAPPTTSQQPSSGLGKGATIGIAVGATIGGIMLIAIIVLSVLLVKKRRVAEKEPMMGGIQHYS